MVLFFLIAVPSSLAFVLALIVLTLVYQDSPLISIFLDQTTIKGIAISIFLLQLSSLGLVLLSVFFVPSTVSILYGLMIIFVSLAASILGASLLGSFSLSSAYGQIEWSGGQDPIAALLLLVGATLFCAWRIEHLRRFE